MKWSDREIVTWARMYKKKKESVYTIESKLGIPHASVWWCFVHRLSSIDYDLFLKVDNKLKRRSLNG